MRTHSTSLALVAVVNDDMVMNDNLEASPMLRKQHVQLIVERGHSSAASAYNAALGKSEADVVIFAHQDVYLPDGWDRKLLGIIKDLDAMGNDWGVLGVGGTDERARLVGRVWSSGLGKELVGVYGSPIPVVSIDELVIVLRRETGLGFDEGLPGFHLYGTDIVQMALTEGYGAYVVDAPVIHNSVPVLELDSGYIAAYRYMQTKWRMKLPIPTTVIPITRSGWPLILRRLRDWRRQLSGASRRWQHFQRIPDPAAVAKTLGYETNS